MGRPRDPHRADVARALARFRAMCRFDPITGCVLWVGGKTKGRGHHVDYGSFWYDARRWFAHRWAARFIHGLDIEAFDVDHCCPHRSLPNTLCVEHLAAETPARNRELQTMRRFVHIQVGLIRYDDVYGPLLDQLEQIDGIPFYSPPAWLGSPHDDDCPF